jgi:hypothetical protein
VNLVTSLEFKLNYKLTNLKTNSKKMENFKTLPSRPLNTGIQYIAKFPNNYGASVVQHQFSYGGNIGLWEIAVVQYEEGETDIHNFKLTYDTPITYDVIGHLEDEEVNKILADIKALPKSDQSEEEFDNTPVLPQDTYDGDPE